MFFIIADLINPIKMHFNFVLIFIAIFISLKFYKLYLFNNIHISFIEMYYNLKMSLTFVAYFCNCCRPLW